MKQAKTYVLTKELTPLMFNEIAEEYDRLDRKLSFGLDLAWRKKLAQYLKNTNKNFEIVTDIAAGTGDMLAELKRLYAKKYVAIDPSVNMLNIAKTKVPDADFIIARAEQLPLPENFTDLITVAFGIRNFSDINRAFDEFYRILKPGGKLAIMEFSVPKNIIPALGFKFYVKYVIPILGYIHSGNYQAYKYLAESIFDFSKRYDIVNMLSKNNFRDIKVRNFIFGGVKIYCCSK